MIEKFFAWYTVENRYVNAYEALELRDRKIIDTNKKNAVLRENPDSKSLPLFPKKGKKYPYFSYYSDDRKKAEVLYSNSGNGISIELSIFKEIFYKLNRLTIYDYRSKEKVDIEIEKSYVEYKIKNLKSDEMFIISILFKLKKTDPYSYYHKWNGYLAIEFKNTTSSTYNKVSLASKKGIHIFEVPIPDKIKLTIHELMKNLNGKYVDRKQFDSVRNWTIKNYSNLYENKKWVAFGLFLGKNHIFFEGWEEMYKKMKQYEAQIQELQNEIEKLKMEKEELSNENKKISNQITQLESKKRRCEQIITNAEKKQEIIQAYPIIQKELKDQKKKNEELNRKIYENNEIIHQLEDRLSQNFLSKFINFFKKS